MGEISMQSFALLNQWSPIAVEVAGAWTDYIHPRIDRGQVRQVFNPTLGPGFTSSRINTTSESSSARDPEEGLTTEGR